MIYMTFANNQVGSLCVRYGVLISPHGQMVKDGAGCKTGLHGKKRISLGYRCYIWSLPANLYGIL